MATDEGSHWQIAYAGDCREPYTVPVNSVSGALFARYQVRCRRCKTCLRARTNYWGYAAMNMTIQSKGRTWFGTLTLSPEAQAEIAQRAFEDYQSDPTGANPSWDDPQCDFVFNLKRKALLKEVQMYWKRLRKAGHAFKYFLVFERHKSGLPHCHFLLHEQDKPITKRALQSQWHLGFTNVSIVGGKAARAAAPEKASWYVVKYLSKSSQARQIASAGYVPKDKKTAT